MTDYYQIRRNAEQARAQAIAEMVSTGFDTLSRAVRFLARPLVNRYRIMQAKNHLYDMTDRQLHDLGITRGEIEFVVDPKPKFPKSKPSYFVEDFTESLTHRLANLYFPK
jgi:uncharacterized protein YjiS (DUF1127 family)